MFTTFQYYYLVGFSSWKDSWDTIWPTIILSCISLKLPRISVSAIPTQPQLFLCTPMLFRPSWLNWDKWLTELIRIFLPGYVSPDYSVDSSIEAWERRSKTHQLLQKIGDWKAELEMKRQQRAVKFEHHLLWNHCPRTHLFFPLVHVYICLVPRKGFSLCGCLLMYIFCKITSWLL